MNWIQNTRLGTLLFIFIVGSMVNMLVFNFALPMPIPAPLIFLSSFAIAAIFSLLVKKPWI